jgi:hypothetical protein
VSDARQTAVNASGAAPSAFTSGHDDGEFDKRLAAALIEARPAIFLDNYNSKDLTSDVLASALTENPCEVRPMGHTTMVKLHTRTLITITGNDVQISEDMASRLIETRYDAKCESPELRPFQPGFLDTVYKERAKLLGHVLTIWRWGCGATARLAGASARSCTIERCSSVGTKRVSRAGLRGLPGGRFSLRWRWRRDSRGGSSVAVSISLPST